MKHNKRIEYLTTAAASISFPKYNSDFDRYTAGLKEILDANFGYSLSKTLEYDDMEQKYFLRLRVSDVLHRSEQGRPLCLDLNTPFSIDPQQPLAPQLDDLRETISHLHNEFNRIRAFGEICNKQGVKVKVVTE